MANQSGFGGGWVVLAFIGGAAIGAAAALLTTPRSGAEIRQQLMTTARETTEGMSRVPPALKAAYRGAADAARIAFVETYKAQMGD